MKKEYSMTEEEILQELRNQNARVIQNLYQTHFPMILHFILNNNGTEQEAKDIYQESFIIFYEKALSDLNLSCKIKTFIYSICRRQWLKRLYERNKFTGINDGMEYIDVEEDIRRAEEEEKDFLLMEASLLSIGEPCRTLLSDFYIENKRMDEIAERFGYTNADNAKNQKYKCLQRLKKIFFGTFKSV